MNSRYPSKKKAAKKTARKVGKATTKKTGKKPARKRYKHPPKKKDDNCFITTACVNYYGLDDDCYQLETLRKFRDNFLLKSPKDKKLVEQYYILAPTIVSKIELSDNKKKLYKNIYKNISLACTAIEENRFKEAKNIYINVVKGLAIQFTLH